MPPWLPREPWDGCRSSTTGDWRDSDRIEHELDAGASLVRIVAEVDVLVGAFGEVEHAEALIAVHRGLIDRHDMIGACGMHDVMRLLGLRVRRRGVGLHAVLAA